MKKTIRIIMGLLISLSVFFSILLIRDQNRQLQTEQIDMETQIIALFYERYGDVQAFAINPIFRSQDKEAMETVLNQYANTYGIYDHIAVIDESGRWISGSSVDSSGNKIQLDPLSSYPWHKEEWFQRALKGQWSDTASGMEGTVVTDILRDQTWQKAFAGSLMHQIFATRIDDESAKSKRVLVNITSLKWITQGISSALSKKKNLSSAHYIVSLSSGTRSFLNLSLDAGQVNQTDWLAPDSFWQSQNGHLASPEGFFRTQVRVMEDENWPRALRWNIAVGIDAFNFYSISAVSALIVIICLVFLLRYTRKHIIELLTQIGESILGVSRSVSQMSQAVKENVGSLVDSVNQEKSLIHEASAATDELFAMAGNNQTEAEGLAKDNSTVLEQMAQAEKSAEEMQERIKSLQEQLHFFQTKLEESTNKLNNTQVQMEAIRKKIQVINEIVFQTKILSFNASVEAAKAGEHGKGFAVVAEEIGNLARMSGESASQITQIVQQSTSEISQTIYESSQTSEEFLSNMNQWAKDAAQSLETLHREFTTLQSLLKENDKRTQTIAQASSEQRLGIEQIVEANQRNNEIVDRIYKQTQDLEVLSREMNQESTKLQKASRQLEQVIQ